MENKYLYGSTLFWSINKSINDAIIQVISRADDSQIIFINYGFSSMLNIKLLKIYSINSFIHWELNIFAKKHLFFYIQDVGQKIITCNDLNNRVRTRLCMNLLLRLFNREILAISYYTKSLHVFPNIITFVSICLIAFFNKQKGETLNE